MWKALRLWSAFFLVFWLMLSSGCMQFRKSVGTAEREFRELGLDITGGVVMSGTHVINYVAGGDSSLPVLLFLHGSPGGWSAFESYLKDTSLRHHFYMVSIDRPGFGYSDFGKPEPSLQAQAEAAYAVLDSLIPPSKEIWVAGHSLGGPVAVKMAILRPAALSGVVLLAGSVDPDLEPREFFRPALKRKIFRYLMPTSFWVSNYEIEELMDELKAMNQEWDRIRCPVLSVHGTADNFVPVGNADFVKMKLTGRVVFRDVRLNGKNHFIPWNSMDTIRSEIIKFAGDGN